MFIRSNPKFTSGRKGKLKMTPAQNDEIKVAITHEIRRNVTARASNCHTLVRLARAASPDVYRQSLTRITPTEDLWHL